MFRFHKFGSLGLRTDSTRSNLNRVFSFPSGMVQQLFVSKTPTTNGVLVDERGGQGTARPVQPGRAYDFDGVNDYLDVPPIPDLTQPFTVRVRFNLDSLGAHRVLYEQWNSSGFLLWVNTTNVLRYDFGLTAKLTTFSVSINTWYDAALTYDGSTARLYVDGTLINSETRSTANYTANSVVGGGSLGGGSSFNGKISDVRIYDRALTADEVATVYNSPSTYLSGLVSQWKCDDTHTTLAYDASGNGNHGTKTNITPANFHYEGSDVPYSFQNQVGYSDFENILKWSSDLGQYPWIRRGLSLVGFSTDPLGGNTAQSFTENGTDANPALFYTEDVTDGTDRTFRVWLKSSVNTTLALTTQGSSKTSEQSITTDWQEFTITSSANGGSGPHIGGFSTISQGGGITIDVWRPQLGRGVSLGSWQSTEAVGVYAPVPRDESDTANDVLGSPLDYSGCVPFNGQAKSANCGTFDGVDDYVLIPASSNNIITTGDFTVSVRVKTTDSNAVLLGNPPFGGAGTKNGVTFEISSGFARLVLTNADGGFLVLSGVSTVNDDQWHSLTYVCDRDSATGAKIYVDGVLDATGNPSTVEGTLESDSYTIGRQSSSAASGFYTGLLADLRVYGSAMDASQVTELHQHTSSLTPLRYYTFSEGSGTVIHDVSGNGNHGTATNITESSFWGTKQDQFHYNLAEGFDQVGTFDGVDDHVIIPSTSINYTANFSISFWFNPNGVPASNKRLLQRYGFAYSIYYLSTGQLAFGTNNGYRNTTASVNDGWHHYVLTAGASTDFSHLKIYRDGVEVSTSTLGTFSSFSSSTANTYLGSDPSVTASTPGKLSDFRVFDSELSSSEAMELYLTASVTGKNATAIYKLDEGKGTTAFDSSGNGNHGTVTGATAAEFWAGKIPAKADGTSLFFTTLTSPAGPWHNGAESTIDFTGGVASPEMAASETAWAWNTARVNPRFHRTVQANSIDKKADRFITFDTALSGNDLAVAQQYTTTIEG